MRPIVIIKEKNKEGKFELTEKELKDLIEQAYEQGFEEGKAQYQPNLNFWQTRRGDITPCKFTPGNYVTDEPCTPAYPHDVFGNPIPYCSGETTGQPNPTTKLNGSAVSTGV